MNLIIVLILGAIVGWLGARIMGRHEGLLASIVIGIVGAFIGDGLAKLLGGPGAYLAFSWSGLLWALIGAIILAALLNAVQHRHSSRA